MAQMESSSPPAISLPVVSKDVRKKLYFAVHLSLPLSFAALVGYLGVICYHLAH